MELFLNRHHRQCLPLLRDYDLVGEAEQGSRLIHMHTHRHDEDSHAPHHQTFDF